MSSHSIVVLRSPVKMDPEKDIPNVSFPEFVLARMKNLNLPEDTPWMVDAVTEQTVNFVDVELHSRKIASFLARRGFKKGDILHFVTYGAAHSYLVQFAAWRLGGITSRGSKPTESKDWYKKTLRETKSKFLVIDDDTGPLLRAAIAELEWEVTLICIGDDVRLRSTITLAKMLADDGTAFPNDVQFDPKNDILMLFSDTNGREQIGTVHHSSGVALLASFNQVNKCLFSESVMSYSPSHEHFTLAHAFLALTQGTSYYHIPKYEEAKLYNQIVHYEPSCVILCPRGALNMVLHNKELDELRYMDILSSIVLTGWEFANVFIAQTLTTHLPRTRLITMYSLHHSLHLAVGYYEPGEMPPIKSIYGAPTISSGKLLPMVEVTGVNTSLKQVLPVGVCGEIMFRSASALKGYVKDGNYSKMRDTGTSWTRSGHIGCFDEQGNIYVQEKIKHTRQSFEDLVSPLEIETLLQTHPDVLAAGVLGIAFPGTHFRCRALVVLKQGAKEDPGELIQFVANRMPSYKQLNFIQFVQRLPTTADGQLDREGLVTESMLDLARIPVFLAEIQFYNPADLLQRPLGAAPQNGNVGRRLMFQALAPVQF